MYFIKTSSLRVGEGDDDLIDEYRGEKEKKRA